MDERSRAWLVGVDWASRNHHAVVVDATGRKLDERSFRHGGEGLAALAAWILALTEAEPDTVEVAIEAPHGPVVETLMARGFRVHAINPKQLDRCRDRFSPAGAKDDSRDALVLADALRTDLRCFRRLRPLDPGVVERRECSRRLEDLRHDRNRLANRVRELLWRYFPAMLDLDDDVAAPWFLELWERVPTPAKAVRVRAATIERLLTRHRIRRLDGDVVLDRLRQPAVATAAGTVEAATVHLQVVVERLGLVNRQIEEAEKRLDRLTERLATATAEATGAATTVQRDVTIRRSLPGVGRIVIATLRAEASEARQRRDYHALRCSCGVAPVTERSGKTKIVIRRLAAHERLANAVYHWARVAVQIDPRSRATHQALRSRGHGQARALRSVADRLLAVACAMLDSATSFDPARTAKLADTPT